MGPRGGRLRAGPGAPPALVQRRPRCGCGRGCGLRGLGDVWHTKTRRVVTVGLPHTLTGGLARVARRSCGERVELRVLRRRLGRGVVLATAAGRAPIHRAPPRVAPGEGDRALYPGGPSTRGSDRRRGRGWLLLWGEGLWNASSIAIRQVFLPRPFGALRDVGSPVRLLLLLAERGVSENIWTALLCAWSVRRAARAAAVHHLRALHPQVVSISGVEERVPNVFLGYLAVRRPAVDGGSGGRSGSMPALLVAIIEERVLGARTRRYYGVAGRVVSCGWEPEVAISISSMRHSHDSV